MRGIERVLAAILLLTAVGGAAVFAHESGSGLAGAVHFAAPPDQHLAAPGTVLIAPTGSADHSQRVLRLAVSPLVTTRLPALSVKTTPLRPATIVPSRGEPGTQTRTVPQAPTPSPIPDVTPTPIATPVSPVAAPVETPARVVASAQPEPVPAPTAPAPEAPAAPAAPAAPIKVTPLPPVTVTIANVHGLAPSPQPPVASAPSD
jgi:hypothetical protein